MSNKNCLLIWIIIILLQNIVIKGFFSSIVTRPSIHSHSSVISYFFFKHLPSYCVDCHQTSKEGSLGSHLSELLKKFHSMRILVAIANTLKMAGFEYKFAQIIPSLEKVF